MVNLKKPYGIKSNNSYTPLQAGPSNKDIKSELEEMHRTINEDRDISVNVDIDEVFERLDEIDNKLDMFLELVNYELIQKTKSNNSIADALNRIANNMNSRK